MKLRIRTIISTVSLVLALVCGSTAMSAQEGTANKNRSVKGEMKASGKEAGKAGKSLGSNVKKGKVVRGGKEFGKHTAKSGKHLAKGTTKSAKKVTKATKDAIKP